MKVVFFAALTLFAQPAFAQDLSQWLAASGAKTNIVKPAQGLLPYPYLVPAGPYFQLFDWDTYFMGVALSYDGVGQPLADSLKDFLSFVGKNADQSGYVPREIAPDALWALPEQCKPFLAQMGVRAAKTLNDYSWLAPLYNGLKLTLTYWEQTRQKPDGLFVWYNGVESGIDNSIVVSNSPTETTEGVDLQVYLVREYEALSLIATQLGHFDDATVYTKKSHDLAERVRTMMWSETDGFFYNIDSNTHQLITGKEWTGITPLWGKIATPEQAKTVVEKWMTSPEQFWSPHGLRTVAKSDPKYTTNGYWQGPVWVISNYFAEHALLNYGYSAQALEIAQKTTDLLVQDFKKSGGMNECYNPETGDPVAGGHFVSWNLLAEHMLDEAQMGTDPAALK